MVFRIRSERPVQLGKGRRQVACFLIALDDKQSRPLILLGDAWRMVFDRFFQELGPYSPPNQRGLLRFARDNAAAISLLTPGAP